MVAVYGAKEGGLRGALTGGVGSYFGGALGNSLVMGGQNASYPQYEGSPGYLSAPNFDYLRESAITKTHQAFDLAGVYGNYDSQSNMQRIMRKKYISLHDKQLFEPWANLVKPKKKTHVVEE